MANINLVPDMTSNTTPEGVVTASSTTGAYYVFDRSAGTKWYAGAVTGWVGYEFVDPVLCNEYTISPYTVLSAPQDFTLRASDTGAFSGEEVTLDSRVGIVWEDGVKQSFFFSTSNSYKYYRIVCTKTAGVEYILYILEVEIKGPIIAEAFISASSSMSMSFHENVSDMNASVSTTSQGKAINTLAAIASASISSDGSRQTLSHGFEVVGEIQFASVVQTFKFVEEIEQPTMAITIQRVNA